MQNLPVVVQMMACAVESRRFHSGTKQQNHELPTPFNEREDTVA